MIRADFGNSRLKIAVGPEVRAFRYSDLDWVAQAVGHMRARDDKDVIFCSVNQPRSDELRGDRRMEEFVWHSAREAIEGSSYPIDFTLVSGLGCDRAVGVVGALSYATFPYVTLDCGTAWTINCVDAKGVFRGGCIMPGIETMSNALAHYTAALPVASVTNDSPFPGQNTVDAISSGLRLLATHGLKGILAEVSRLDGFGREVVVIVTGGSSSLIFPWLKDSAITAILAPNLVLEGLARLSLSV